MNIVVPQLNHFIHGGMYYREATVKAGTLVVGCTHKKESIAILISGAIKQIDGDKEYIVEAPAIVKTESGSQRYAYAIEDTIYATVTTIDANTLSDAEDESYEEKPINRAINDDYKSFLIDSNVTDEDIKKDMELVDVYTYENNNLHIDISGVDGYGVFTSRDFSVGDIVGYAFIDDKKTVYGRYINHSPYQNVYYDSNGNIIALYDLIEGQEIFFNYRDYTNRRLI